MEPDITPQLKNLSSIPETPPVLPQPVFVTLCPFCSLQLPANAFFCIHCGKKLKSKPVGIGLLPQLWLYFLSLCLPPLGIGLTIRYIKDDSSKAKKIGWISLLMTVVSIVFAIFAAVALIQNMNSLIEQQISGAPIDSGQINQVLDKYGIDQSLKDQINQSIENIELQKTLSE